MKKYSLKELRESNKLTQSEVAKLADVSKDYISMLERGLRNPSDKMKEKLSKIYKVELYQIFLASQSTKCTTHKQINKE